MKRWRRKAARWGRSAQTRHRLAAQAYESCAGQLGGMLGARDGQQTKQQLMAELEHRIVRWEKKAARVEKLGGPAYQFTVEAYRACAAQLGDIVTQLKEKELRAHE